MYFSTVKDQGIRLVSLTLRNISRTCLLLPAPRPEQLVSSFMTVAAHLVSQPHLSTFNKQSKDSLGNELGSCPYSREPCRSHPCLPAFRAVGSSVALSLCSQAMLEPSGHRQSTWPQWSCPATTGLLSLSISSARVARQRQRSLS